MPTTDKSPASNKNSRSLGIALGVTEKIFLLGLTLLTVGIVILFGFAWALVTAGGMLIALSVFNAIQPGE